MTLSNTVVGQYSTMTLDLTSQNSIPQDGYINVFFPKWNPYASTPSQMESYISTSTSPGSVPCYEQLVYGGAELDCIFTQYTEYDVLKIGFDGYISSDVPASTQMQFTIEDTRAPPTTSPTSKGSSKGSKGSKGGPDPPKCPGLKPGSLSEDIKDEL